MNKRANKADTSEVLTAVYAGKTIEFRRAMRRSTAKSVLIKIRPEGEVTALAPASASTEDVIAAVEKRGRWVSKQLDNFREQNEHVLARRYISGETHLYLGRQYILKVLVGNYTVGVKLLRGVLEVYVRDASPSAVKTALSSWYRLRARTIFNERMDALLPKALWVEDRPPIRLFEMKTQWGNCSPAGRLTMNPQLVKAQTSCIDYVILHELCHIAEHNHSDRFYRLMGQVMPNWKEVKYRLDEMAGKILS